jgi:hypothetical protein
MEYTHDGGWGGWGQTLGGPQATQAAPPARGFWPDSVDRPVASPGQGAEKVDDRWSGAGGTINAGLTTGFAATGLEPLAAVMGAYEAFGDALGAGAASVDKDAGFSAASLTGGMLRGMWGDESIGAITANAMGGGTLGWINGTMTNMLVNLNPVGLLAQEADTVGGGLINMVGNMADKDEERNDYWGSFKGGVADTFGSLLSW